MDLIFEYVDRYKHHPRSVPGLTWHEFLSLVDRTGRSQARDRLQMADAVARGQPVDPSLVGVRMMEQRQLERVAFPRG